MEIAERFGRRTPRQEPRVPAVSAPNPVEGLAVPATEAEKQQADVIQYLRGQGAALVRAQSENAQLRNELSLAHARISDLQNKLGEERADYRRHVGELRHDTEMYRRYSVEIKTHLQQLIDIARRANDAAIDAGERTTMSAEQAEQVIERTEEELRNSAAGEVRIKGATK